MLAGMESLYRRPLPPALIAFASPEGRALFDAARAAGGMEAFFPLIEQFHTQAEPAFCGLGTLVVALNALGVDPGRLWKGPWRWFSEELLDCCSPLERVRERGLTLDEVACLARCNGAGVEVSRPDAHDVAAFRGALAAAARTPASPVMIVSYSRRALGQTGDGHFSPIGGYDPGSDHALVLDVARFKYPPHWVPVPALHAAMLPVDAVTGRPRGWMLLRRRERPASLLFTARCVGDDSFEALPAALAAVQAALREAAPRDLESALRAMFAAVSRFPVTIAARELAFSEHGSAAGALLAALRDTPVHAAVAAADRSPWSADAATLLVLALPEHVWSPLPDELRARWLALLGRERLSPALRVEVDHVRGQIADLCALRTASPCARCG